jgi:hypothetical protein
MSGAEARATTIPPASEQAHDLAGLITVGGFLAAFVLTRPGARGPSALAAPAARLVRTLAGGGAQRWPSPC